MREIAHDWRGATLRHELFGGSAARPGVILFPTVVGVSDLERGFAARLVERGYAAIVADLYGRRFTPGVDREAAFAAMRALQADRGAMRELLAAVFEKVRAQDEIEEHKIAAIGFCFGGQCALDLARSGADIAGVASFHGLFVPPGWATETTAPQPITAKVAAFHGWDDPLATPDALVALGKELTESGADWRITAYGNVGHGFTNPGATGAMPGIKYDERTARRAWAECDAFLAECFE